MHLTGKLKWLFYPLFAAAGIILFSAAQNVYNKWMILTMIIDKIERFYVDEKPGEELFDSAVQGVLQSLDPHSAYLSPSSVEQWRRKYEGYHGIGLKYRIHEGLPVVISLTENGPAALAGVRLGDVILAIDGVSLEQLKIEQIRELILGPVGSSIELNVRHARSSSSVTLRVQRQHIKVESVPCAFLLNDSTGYIRISHFSDSTPMELDLAYARLNGHGMQQLLVDLRDNMGGTLSAGVAVADRFLSEGKMIVYTQGRTRASTKQYMASKTPTMPPTPLVLLVNEATASDAEILAGALQDWDRALIVGRPTYGKGVVQTEFPFQDGSSLLLTTAKYYTPLGRSIQRSEPYPPSNHGAVFRTPAGRSVYGGGGIYPDVLLQPPESGTMPLTVPPRNLLDYCATLAGEQGLGEMGLDVFARNFKVTPDMIHACFQNSAAPAGSAGRGRQALLLKMEIAEILWGTEGQFAVRACADPQVQKSVDFLAQARELLR